jgi:hypothetical protein
MPRRGRVDLSAVLEIVARHGCVTSGALARVARIARHSAQYALRALWRSGAVRRYAVGRDVSAWCAGPLGDVLVSHGSMLVRLSARRLALALLGRLALRRGLSVRLYELLRDAGVPQYGDRRGRKMPPPALVKSALALLELMLDGTALALGRSRGGSVILITDAAGAVERLRRVIEDGALPVEPMLPPNSCDDNRRQP